MLVDICKILMLQILTQKNGFSSDEAFGSLRQIPLATPVILDIFLILFYMIFILSSSLGYKVALHPWRTIFITLWFVVILSLGLFGLQKEGHNMNTLLPPG
jgi:hypothetical protein